MSLSVAPVGGGAGRIVERRGFCERVPNRALSGEDAGRGTYAADHDVGGALMREGVSIQRYMRAVDTMKRGDAT